MTQSANTEPTSSILLRTFVLAGLGAGCVLLSRVQLSRVLTIAGLAGDRAELLTDLVGVEARERTRLAEQLHDGALQYVLAARQDLEDVRERADPDAFERLEHALTQTSTLLRSTVTDLHPAVLHAAGLTRALRELVQREAERTGADVRLDATRWPDTASALDDLIYSTARELLTNVAKHAHASTTEVTLERIGDQGRLVVADDGRGMDESRADARLAEGHVGLASLKARVAASGGTVTIGARSPAGTVVTVLLPLTAG